ncbi:MAG: tetratricopeptide repeat protein [Thermoanaerobaculales bacterium]
MRISCFWARTGVLLAMVVAIGVGTAVGGDSRSKEARHDMEWGFKAARRGYWQLALQRFEHANELTPDQPRILNNIAVAQEANGLFEEALLTYQTGLAIAPKDRALHRNYTRFKEFYESFVAEPEEPDDPEAGDEETVAEGADDA